MSAAAALDVVGAAPPWHAIVVGDDDSVRLLASIGLPGVRVGDRALEHVGPGARVLLVGGAAESARAYLAERGADLWTATLAPGGGDTLAELFAGYDRATEYAGLTRADLQSLFQTLVQDVAVPDIIRPPAATPIRRAGPRLLSIYDIANAPPRQWLVARLLARQEFAVLVGAPASYKSFLALDLAFAICDGREFLGLKTERGSVVYVAGEGVGGLTARIPAAIGVARFQAADDPVRQCFHMCSTMPDFSSDRSVDEFAALVQPHSPRLVAVDTWARAVAAAGGDENKASDTGRLIAGIDGIRERVGCAVLAIHHTGKAEGASERGSSALRGAADMMFDLRTTGALAARLTTTKAKDAASPAWDLAFAESVVGADEFGPVTSLHLSGYAPASSLGPASSKTATGRAAILDAVREAGAAGLSFEEAKAAASRGKSTVSGTLAGLVEEEVLEPFKVGKARRWRLRS